MQDYVHDRPKFFKQLEDITAKSLKLEEILKEKSAKEVLQDKKIVELGADLVKFKVSNEMQCKELRERRRAIVKSQVSLSVLQTSYSDLRGWIQSSTKQFKKELADKLQLYVENAQQERQRLEEESKVLLKESQVIGEKLRDSYVSLSDS